MLWFKRVKFCDICRALAEMNGEKPKRKKIFGKLKNKFRLVIMNDDTLEEKASLVLSPLNVFVVAGSVILFLIVFGVYIIAFTPLREYIPGYMDVNLRRNLILLNLKADSLSQALHTKDLYIQNINNIINDRIPSDTSARQKANPDDFKNVQVSPSEEETELRKNIEAQDKYSLAFTEEKTHSSGIKSFFFFVPLIGTVTTSFNALDAHFGVDLVSAKNSPIKSTLDGTVIFAGWTSETGYVIQVQHENNLVSIYKHNSVLLKKSGDKVKAGEAIAIIGESGELSTGPHLHFELWYNGRAIDPQDYIAF